MWVSMLLAVLVPPGAALLIYRSREERHVARGRVALGAAFFTLLLVFLIFNRVTAGETPAITLFHFLGAGFNLRADHLSLIFAFLCSFLWIPSLFYALGYMEKHQHHRRFFAFYVLNLGVALGMAFAGNLFTFFIFFKLFTLTTFPLVAHGETPGARKAALTYVYYSVGSGALLLFTVMVFLHLFNTGVVPGLAFTPGGILDRVPGELEQLVYLAFAAGFLGFGVKAALVPLHSWLPSAMVAVAPVSALFHAVAVVNTGIFGIMRLIYYVFGPAWLQATGTGLYWVLFVILTVLGGSVMAIRSQELKLRLAYSTVSQMGYLVLGLLLLSPAALTGSLLHLFNHAFLKITLFFAAGIILSGTGKSKINQLAGVGKVYRPTMQAFSIAALGLMGIPPICGYLVKIFLLRSSLALGTTGETILVISVVLLSALLNAVYYLPIVIQSFWGKGDYTGETPGIQGPGEGLVDPGHEGGEEGDPTVERPLLLYPVLATAVISVILGIFPAFLTMPLVEPVIRSLGW